MTINGKLHKMILSFIYLLVNKVYNLGNKQLNKYDIYCPKAEPIANFNSTLHCHGKFTTIIGSLSYIVI